VFPVRYELNLRSSPGFGKAIVWHGLRREHHSSAVYLPTAVTPDCAVVFTIAVLFQLQASVREQDGPHYYHRDCYHHQTAQGKPRVILFRLEGRGDT
jgi:hypothetical protein